MRIKYSRPGPNRRAVREMGKHERKRLMNVHLSRELRGELKTRSLPVRKGDTVLVLKGKHAGWQKKVIRVNLKKIKLQIDGLKSQKTDGTEIFYYLHPSNLVLTALAKREDRKAVLERIANSKHGG